MSRRSPDPIETPQDWERVIAAAAYVQQIVPDAILVGGSAAALYADHRYSADDDHVVGDLKERFETVLHDLEDVAGWRTNRITPPVLILGNFRGIDTGIRQLRRTEPLETVIMPSPVGNITIPTLPEMLRIKSWLVVSRNATRDYIDVIALSDKLGISGSIQALATIDTLYPQPDASVLQQLVKQLAEPRPYDEDADLRLYKGLRSPYNDKAVLFAHCRHLGSALFRQLQRMSPTIDRERGPSRS